MAKKKSLQKLTEIEVLDSPTQVREYLTANPKDYEKILDNLEERYADTFKNKLGKEHDIFEMVMECYRVKGYKDQELKMRNITYETNHALISACAHNYINANRIFPTIQSIAEETGLSRTTIYSHLSQGLGHKYNKLVTGKLEYMTLSALGALYHIGTNDRNANALKAFIELSGAVTKVSSNTVNNYIQINNLKLSVDEFEQLPKKTILEIENLITKMNTSEIINY